ncbi:WD_REPEATS_REGION domain-containing protein, partial [Linnemannia gamsii]
MSFSHQDNPPPNPNATTLLLFDGDKLTADGKRTLSELERTTKVGRTLSSEDLPAGLQCVQHCNSERPDSTPESFASTSHLMTPTALLVARGQHTATTPLAQRQEPRVTTSIVKDQTTQMIENTLDTLRTRILSHYTQAVYIPPLAKPNLKAENDKQLPLMDTTQDFLAGDGQVMLILGDSGAGKSTFNRHLENSLWKDYKTGGRIPLFINLPAIERPNKELVEEQLRIHGFSEDEIHELKQNRQFMLICDGYDESQLTTNLHNTNLLNQSEQWDTKMILTCRTQYLGPNYRSRFMPLA